MAAGTIWIVNPYGTLPSEGWREYRSAMLARALVRRGYDVRWWLSDIEHRSKQRRPVDVVDPLLPPGITVHIVPTTAYQRNISLGRIRYERSFAAGFAHAALDLPHPDLIVLADPSLFFAAPVVAYARKHGISFVLDVLDLWPELFDILLPGRSARLGRAVFAPLYRRRDRLVAQAAAVVAVTQDYLDAVTVRRDAVRQLAVYLGVDTTAFPPPVPRSDDGGPLEVVYAGTLGDAYDMGTVVAAIDRIAADGDAIRFTIAGDGPWRERIAALAARHPGHVRFLGTLPARDLIAYYSASHVGLMSYSAGSTVSMPVKFYDYMAAGLATVGAIGGEAKQLLQQGAGSTYCAGDAASLVAALRRYNTDRPALHRTRATALSLSRDFDAEVQHERFAQLVDDIVTRKESQCCD